MAGGRGDFLLWEWHSGGGVGQLQHLHVDEDNAAEGRLMGLCAARRSPRAGDGWIRGLGWGCVQERMVRQGYVLDGFQASALTCSHSSLSMYLLRS
jgi:hypothetical protein